METQGKTWEKIVKKLIEKNMTIATMESCTGGGIANEIKRKNNARKFNVFICYTLPSFRYDKFFI